MSRAGNKTACWPTTNRPNRRRNNLSIYKGTLELIREYMYNVLRISGKTPTEDREPAFLGADKADDSCECLRRQNVILKNFFAKFRTFYVVTFQSFTDAILQNLHDNMLMETRLLRYPFLALFAVVFLWLKKAHMARKCDLHIHFAARNKKKTNSTVVVIILIKDFHWHVMLCV